MKENIENIKKLEKKVLNIGGDVIHIVDRKYLSRWLNDGEGYDGKDSVIEEGKAMMCQENSLQFYLKHKEEGMKLCLGYALSNDYPVWTYHAWCMDEKGRIHECTPVKRDLYYGITLDEREVEMFRRDVDLTYGAECARREGTLSPEQIGERSYLAQQDSRGKQEMCEFLEKSYSKDKGEKDGKTGDNAKSL